MPTMTGLLSLLATGVLVALGFWLLGGVVLRVGGVLLVAVGLLSTAATGSPSAALLTVLGGLAWLGGQWLFGRATTTSARRSRGAYSTRRSPGSLTPRGDGASPMCRRSGGRAKGVVVAHKNEQQAPGRGSGSCAQAKRGMRRQQAIPQEGSCLSAETNG